MTSSGSRRCTGAEVKATQTEKPGTWSGWPLPGLRRRLCTLSSLALSGPYKLEVKRKAGFSTYLQTGIVLQVATNPTIDVQLRASRRQFRETVQVEANAAQVETQNTSVGTVIENQRILDLPLNGRSATDLIQLTGAAIPAGPNGTAGFPGGQNIMIAGGLLSGVGYFLDGTLYNNPFDATNLPFPFPDALQEFKVETSTLTAQNGSHSAAAINAGSQIRHQRLPWRRVRIPPQRRFERPEFFRHYTRHAETQPIRRYRRWTNPERQAILLLRVSGHQGAPGSERHDYLCSHSPDAGREFRPVGQRSCNGGKSLTAPWRGVNNVLSRVADQSRRRWLAVGKSLFPQPNNPNDPCRQGRLWRFDSAF